MLSVFMTPWTNPTSIHRATSDACASTTRSKKRRGSGWRRRRRRGGGGRWRSRRAPQRAGVAGRGGVLERADPQVARGDPGQHRAGQRPLARAPARRWRPPRAPAWSGSRGACIASPIRYSRSIGPTAALPSPPRANGVRPEPFRCRSRRRPWTSTTSPSSSARPSPSRGDVARRTGGRRRPGRPSRLPPAPGPPAARHPAAPAARRDRRPAPLASSSLSTSSSGAGTGAAAHGTDRPGTSRA